jgi:hypothetical protein
MREKSSLSAVGWVLISRREVAQAEQAADLRAAAATFGRAGTRGHPHRTAPRLDHDQHVLARHRGGRVRRVDA